MVSPTGGGGRTPPGSPALTRQGAIRRSSSSEQRPTAPLGDCSNQDLANLSPSDQPSPVGGATALDTSSRSRASSLSSLDTLLALDSDSDSDSVDGAKPLQSLQMLKKPELSSQQLLSLVQKMQPYATACNYLYSHDSKDIPVGWKRLDLTAFKNSSQDIVSISADNIFHNSSGLTASLFETTNGSLCLAFGGTTAGESGGKFMKRMGANIGETSKQWLANAKNAMLGRTPEIYQQAKDLTKIIQDAHPEQKLIITGHSLGGGMGQYAAATLGTPEKPIPCYGFCSAELGQELQTEILEKCGNDQGKFEALVSQIQHLKIKGDMVPNAHKVFKNISSLGSSNTIEALGPRDPLTMPQLDKHINFLTHVNSYIEKNVTDSSEA